MKALLPLLLFLSILINCGAQSLGGKVKELKIKIEVDGQTFHATLEDNATARDFIGLLPAQFKLKDFASSEKITKALEGLSISQAPEGYSPKTGDIAYYSPWKNIALFYHDAGYARGLIKLGRISDNISKIATIPENSLATFSVDK